MSRDDVAVLAAREDDWIYTLERLLRAKEAAIGRVRANVHGPERGLVLADFEDERQRIEDVLTALTEEPDAEPEPEVPGVPQLQLSWTRGRLVAWAAGRLTPAESADEVRARLRAAGAQADAWSQHATVPLPDDIQAEALTASVRDSLGWLVALGSDTAPSAEEGDRAHDPEGVGASTAWLGRAAELAVRLAVQGRMVPQLEQLPSEEARGRAARAPVAVHWVPALVDAEELNALAGALPGAVMALAEERDPRAFTQAVLGDFLDAITRVATLGLEVPAPPPDVRSDQDVAETVLARLDGSPFTAPVARAGELAKNLQRWAAPVIAQNAPRLVVQLDAPDEGAWPLRTLTSSNGRVVRVDAAMAGASPTRRESLKRELDRLERLFPALLRGKGRRRGQVVLSQEEAWELMTEGGQVLTAAGFDVRVPPLSRRKPAPGLRLTSEAPADGAGGAAQLTSVRWSAVFDDVELSAEDIRRLAGQARPLVQAHGRWVELDKADLEAAADALAERAGQTELTGAELLRQALGLDGSVLPGGVSVTGSGWAADLVRSAAAISDELPTRPEGFNGELRTYQAEALAWLRFLGSAGLGGVLALDMGLGKTPTLLAHLTAVEGPALVIAPPAVVGNWAAEARRFVPGLRVVVHHGAGRAADLAELAGRVDVIITTYGTAVRDIGALEDIAWGAVALDEAQVIKNPASETALTLRRLKAHTRVALTGTPVENGLGDLWALLDFTNPGLVGDRASFVAQLSRSGDRRSTAEQALRTLNGVLVFRRTKAEPAIAAELPDRIDVLDNCPLTPEQVGLYQAVLDDLVAEEADEIGRSQGAVLAAITALKQICNHPAAYAADDDGPLEGRSGKLARLEEILSNAFAAGERVLIFTHFAQWGERLSTYLSRRTGVDIGCYHGGLTRTVRDRLVREFQEGEGAGALVLSLKAGGTGLNLTAANHVVLYDRWWNPAVEDQARDRAWRIGQTKTVISHRLIVPGTVDERVEEVVAGKRRIADMVLPASSSVEDLRGDQLRAALGLDTGALLVDEDLADIDRRAA